MQEVLAGTPSDMRVLKLPDPEQVIWPGLCWGFADHLLTPAFWAGQTWMDPPVASDEEFGLGRTLQEELVYCLLGSHGAPAEVGLAAAERVCLALQDYDVASISCDALNDVLLDLLLEPLDIKGRKIRYRFARQRAMYLAGSLIKLRGINEKDLDDTGLRDALTTLPGVGLKTASWIVRNRRGSDRVAILDIHIVRACAAIGVFPKDADPAKHYRILEEKFLNFSEAIGARSSHLDATMWRFMRTVGTSIIE